MAKIVDYKRDPNNVEKRILENQEIILWTLYKMILKNFDYKSDDSKTINALIDCYHATRKINCKSFIERGSSELLDKDLYEE